MSETQFPKSQSEQREEIVSQFMSRFPAEIRYTHEEVKTVVTEMVKEIQNQIGPSLDDFAAVLWSNENGGHDGRLSELRRAGRAVVTETDKILGPGR